MANVVEQRKFVMVEADENHNKLWIVTLFDNDTVRTEWGRVGKALQSKDFPNTGRAFMQSKIREKTGKGYKEFHDAAHGELMQASPVNLEEAAVAQIAGGNRQLADLVRYWAQKNRHSILGQTTITYSDTTGLFSTPLGVVSQWGLDNAKALLIELRHFVNAHRQGERRFTELVEEYLTLIPQDVGRKLEPAKFLPDADAIKKQTGILEALQASLDTLARGSVSDVRKVWDIEFEEMGTDEVRRVKGFYEATRKTMHEASFLQVARVYRVLHRQVHEAYEQTAPSLGNVMRLWHGTKTHNLLSIFARGLVVPDTYVNGWSFGRGIYATDISTKALQYAYGYWDGQRERRCFMFIVDCAMGRPLYAGSKISGAIPPGYDSVIALPENVSTLLNNEMVLRGANQVDLVRLVEFNN